MIRAAFALSLALAASPAVAGGIATDPVAAPGPVAPRAEARIVVRDTRVRPVRVVRPRCPLYDSVMVGGNGYFFRTDAKGCTGIVIYP